jgi:predicted RNase H-like HicB family nuclease
MVRQFKIVVERHADAYVAYPIGLKGVVIGEGESFEEALADVRSAIQFHVETFKGHSVDFDVCASTEAALYTPEPHRRMRLLGTPLPYCRAD